MDTILAGLCAPSGLKTPPVCTHTWPYFLSCTLAAVRTCTCYVRASNTTRTRLYYDTCAPLHPPVYMYVYVRDQNDNAMYASTRWVLTVRQFLACENVAGGSQLSEGRIVFFCPDALPCCGRGPSCQPLHVQFMSDGSRSLTTLTTPRREQQGGGRRRGLGRGRRGAGEDAAVEARAERSTRVHWFGCGVRLLSP